MHQRHQQQASDLHRGCVSFRELREWEAAGQRRERRQRRRQLVGECLAWILFAIVLAVVLGGLVAFGQTTQPVTRPTTRPVTAPGHFVIACYQQPLENLKVWAARGCNAAVGPELGNPPRVTAQQWCAEAERLGLKVIGNKFLLDTNYRPPNLIAWIVRDEPTSANHNYSVAAIAAEAAAFRAVDASVPVICNHAGDKLTSASAGTRDNALYEAYVRAVDVSWADWYPVNREFNRYPLTFKGDELEYLWARGATAVGSVIECSWQYLNKGSPKGRCPTPDEVEREVQIAVEHGASWITYFSTAEQGPDGWPKNYDPTPDDVAARITLVNGRLNPPAGSPATPSADIAALRQQIAELNANLAITNARQDAQDQRFNDVIDALNKLRPATRPTTQPGGN